MNGPTKLSWAKRHPVWIAVIAGVLGFISGVFADVANLLLERELHQRDRAAQTRALLEYVGHDCTSRYDRALSVMESELKEEDSFYGGEVERLGNIAGGRGLYGGGAHQRAVDLAKLQHEERTTKIKNKPAEIQSDCNRVLDSLKTIGGTYE